MAIVVLMRNEALALPALLRFLAALDPAPNQVLAMDGGSTDQSTALAARGAWRANRVCLRVGVSWALSIRQGLARHYTEVR